MVGSDALLLLLAIAAPQSPVPQSPVPQPFPGARPAAQAPATRAPAAQTPANQPPANQTPATQSAGAPTEVTVGAPIYPGAQFLVSYNAGQGQTYYLFGASATFAEIVAYYRSVLKTRGELVFEEPATHMFDTGRFREETMAFPPSVTVKDYTWGGKGGYLNPKAGSQPQRFPTVIQIVPAPTGAIR